jgi:hypothetical protein
MTEKEKLDVEDWEYQEDFYKESEQKKKVIPSLEELAKEAEEPENSEEFAETHMQDEQLKKTIEDVKRVKALYKEGKNVPEIAEKLEMEEEYVTMILLTMQGYSEDNDIAIAHLVVQG